MDLVNVSKNQRRSKKREWNEYGKVTELIKKYKVSQDDNDILVILKELEGIINSFTIMLAPGNAFQQIHVNPFMAKFLGMFLTPEERVGTTVDTYHKAIGRVRWIMRKSDYNDIYSHILYILTHTIKTMKVIGDCDCIYYIQLITRYKMHDLVMKSAKDAGVALSDIPLGFDRQEENFDDILDRLSFSPENMRKEDELIEDMYSDLDISILTRTDDIWQCFSYFEKYLIYLKDIMCLTDKQMLSIIRNLTQEELTEWLEDIQEKCTLIAKEGD